MPQLSRSGPAAGENGRRLLRAAVLALLPALPAAAAPATDRPFEPDPALAELSAASGPTRQLKSGILCAAWARDMIDQHWRMLNAEEGPGTWSAARQRLWNQLGWVEEFEAAQLRPVIDAQSQAEMVAAWWPEGVGTPSGSAAAARMHGFCLALPGLLGTVDPASPYGF